MKKWFILLATSGLLVGCDQANQGGTGTDQGTTGGQDTSPTTPTPSQPGTVTNQAPPATPPATPPPAAPSTSP